MTTNEKREPLLSVGFDIMQELIKREGTRATIDTRFWLANRITEAVNAARTAGRDDLLRAYDAGFAASSEGWNGEYPGDAETRDTYRLKRHADLFAVDDLPPSP